MSRSTYAEYARCDSCGAVFQRAAGDLAQIPDLLQRIEPGGEVPAAECPKCGALAYVVRGAPLPVYIIEKGWGCHRGAGELIILVHDEKRDFVADVAEVLSQAQQVTMKDGCDIWTYPDDVIPRLLEKGYQLARFQAVAGE